MKKLLTLLLIIITSTAFAQTEVNGVMIKMNESQDNTFTYKNDTLSVAFKPAEFFWDIKVNNESTGDFSIIWEKCSFIHNGAASKIVFGNTSRLMKNIPIQDQEVPTKSFINRSIFPVEYVNSSSLYPIVSKKYLSKRFEKTAQPDQVKIVLAVKLGDIIRKYDFNFVLTPKNKS